MACSNTTPLSIEHLDSNSLKLVANDIDVFPHQERASLLSSIQHKQTQSLPFVWKSQTLAALPTAMYGFSIVEHKGCMYLHGGRSGSADPNEQFNADFLCFDPSMGCWKVLDVSGDIPPPRRWHSAIVYQDQMLVFGGQVWTGTDWEATNSMLAFSFHKQSWSELKQHGTIPLPKSKHCATVLGGTKLVIIPGDVTADARHLSSLTNVCLFDLETSTWTTKYCEGCNFNLRGIEATTAYKDSIYVLIADESKDKMAMYKLCTKTFAWNQVPAADPPCSRRQCSAVQVDGSWLLSGGVSTVGDAQFVFSDQYSYSFEAGKWQQLQVDDERIPTARASHCGTTLNGSAVFVGGWHQRWPGKLDNIIMHKEFLSPSSNSTGAPNVMLGKSLSRMRSSMLFADVLLVSCDQQEFPAHRVVLASQSEVFEKMFTNQMQENTTGKVTMPEASGEVVSALLDFLYGGL